MGSRRRQKEAGGGTYAVVLHADPGGDIVGQLQRKQAVLELLEVQLVFVHLARQSRIDPLCDPRFEVLPDLE